MITHSLLRDINRTAGGGVCRKEAALLAGLWGDGAGGGLLSAVAQGCGERGGASGAWEGGAADASGGRQSRCRPRGRQE